MIGEGCMKPFLTKNCEELVEKYQGFILSVEGVLFLRGAVRTDAIAFLQYLSTQEKTVAILANSSSRSQPLIEKLMRFGIPPSLYQYLTTSAEEAYQHLKFRKDPWHSALGRRVYCIGTTQDARLLDDIGYTRTNDLESADFILLVSLDEHHQSFEDYNELLRQGASLELKLVCANPNRLTFQGTEKQLCAGSLASYYERIGGEVYYHGKPYPSIYHTLLRELSALPGERLLAVGGLLYTDILGARSVGIDTAFLLSDLTVDELNLSPSQNEELSFEKISEKIRLSQIQPTYILEALINLT